MKKAMLGLMLVAVMTVGAAPKVAQLNKEIAQVNKEIAAATKKKLSGAAEVEKGYEKLFALLKEAGRPVPFDQAMARIQYLSEFDLKPVAELRKEAAPKLFNFEYDLQQAWGKWQAELDFVEN